MIKGSHNTMSYLPSTKWWMNILGIFGKCQTKTIKQQIEDDCEFFDLRVRLNENNEFVFCHGIVEYNSNESIFDIIRYLSKVSRMLTKTIYIRLWYEKSSPLTQLEHEKWIELITKIEETKYRNILISYGIKYDYSNNVKNYKIWGKNLIEDNENVDKWYKIILTPKFWDWKKRKTKYSKYKNIDDIISFDFV